MASVSRSPDPVTTPPKPPSIIEAATGSIRSSVLVALVRALLSAGAVLTIGRLIDDLSAGDPTGNAVAWLIGLLAMRVLLAPGGPLLAATTAGQVERNLRRRLLDAMVRIGPTDADRRTGALITQATEGVGAVGDYAGRFVPQLIGGMVIPLVIIAVTATIDITTAAVLLIAMPVMPGLLRIMERRFTAVTARYRQTADALASQFYDGLQGLRTLTSMDRAEDYGNAIADESERLRVETMRLLRVNQLALLAVDSLFTIGTVVLAATMAAWRLSNNLLTVGEAVAIVLLGVMLIEPLLQIGRFFYVGAIGRASASQLRRLFAAAPDVTSPRSSTVADGVVSLSDVRFSYGEGHDVLRGITFHIEPRERVALVGPSGAGKTTVASVIAGLQQPRTGSVQVGGRVALVPQRPYLFHGTVADNLRLALPDADADALWRVLEDAELAEVLRSRDGLETKIGERGITLSGGEAQRLAIARAFLVDAPIVVLDEPTSNVDLETEHRVRSAVDRLTENRTVLIIAHRRSTIVGADRVVRLERGRLTAEAVGPGAIALIDGNPTPGDDDTDSGGDDASEDSP